MKILLISYAFAPTVGGIETVSRLLAEEFLAAGHEVRVVTDTPGNSEASLPYPVSRRPDWLTLLKWHAWCHVVFHNNISMNYAWPLWVIRRPWIVAHHVWLGQSADWRGRLKKRALGFAKNLAVSQAIADRLPVPSEIVGDPYDNGTFCESGLPVKKEDLIFVGRLVSDKGVDLLLTAMKNLAERGVCPNLSIVGDGSEKTALQQLTARFGLAGQVSFLGQKNPVELANLLRAHRVQVVPSRWEEPFGIVALEGLACGCKLIVPDSGGLREAAGSSRGRASGEACPFAKIPKGGRRPPLPRRLRIRPQKIIMKILRTHWLFLAVMAGYAALVIPQLDRGLASGDGHFVLATARELADHHHVTFSRPPGHPTTEFYLYGGIGFLLRSLFDQPLSDTLYLWLQFSAGLIMAVVFYEWLGKLGTSPWKAACAVCCLVFSAQFLNNTMDGEEFVIAILLLVAALRFLTPGEHGSVSLTKICVSMLCYALAVGCRPELLFVGLIYPIYFWFVPELGWKRYLKVLPVQIGFLALVWLPILLSVGLVAPWGAGMNWKQAILGGGYKLTFQCFTLPAFVLFCWTLISAARTWKGQPHARRPANFILPACWFIAVVYIILFFTYAAKPGYALVIVPFCVLLAAQQSPALLAALAICTLLGLCVSIDIFHDRRLTAPHLKPGVYSEITRTKPFYKQEYLNRLSLQCGQGPTAIIADVCEWDVEYHLARGTFQVERRVVPNGTSSVPIFAFPHSQCLLLTADVASHTELLQNLHTQGFSITMDRMPYRRNFEKYDIHAPDSKSATIAGVPITLFSE
jgi:glycosyltransferase involved in cell wall biosynthesis